MEFDRFPSIKVPKFKGLPEKWVVWRDGMESLFGGCDLFECIDHARPDDDPGADPNPRVVWDNGQQRCTYIFT